MTPDHDADDPRECHCGAPVAAESDPEQYADLGPAAHGLCERCLPLRCDVEPGACARAEDAREARLSEGEVERLREVAMDAAWAQFARMPSSNAGDITHAIIRTLAPVVAAIRAEAARDAWDEGWNAGFDDLKEYQPGGGDPFRANPYRALGGTADGQCTAHDLRSVEFSPIADHFGDVTTVAPLAEGTAIYLNGKVVGHLGPSRQEADGETWTAPIVPTADGQCT